MYRTTVSSELSYHTVSGDETKWARQGAGWPIMPFLPFCRRCILLRVMFRGPNIVSSGSEPGPGRDSWNEVGEFWLQ